MVWNLFSFKGDFNFGKNQKSQVAKSSSLVAVWIKSLATAAQCSFYSGSRNCGMIFATCFMARSCVKISDSVSFGIPRSASSHLSLLIAAPTHSTFLGVLVAGLPEHGSLTTDSWPSLKHLFHTFYLCSTHCIVPKSLLNHLNSFHGGMLSLMQNLMQIHCSTYSVILNVTATQYTCSLKGFYHPHWLVQWSHYCVYMHIPVHTLLSCQFTSMSSKPLLMLTMAGLSSDRPHLYLILW